jgi:hypothetical protein
MDNASISDHRILCGDLLLRDEARFGLGAGSADLLTLDVPVDGGTGQLGIAGGAVRVVVGERLALRFIASHK